MFKPAATVFRKQEIRGVSIPAIVKNLDHHFTELQVFEDGWVECWGLHDLEEFINQMNKGFANTAVPDGESISIHHLGSWEIENSEWVFDKGSFISYIKSLIREMNPEWKDAYTYIEKTQRSQGVSIKEPEGIFKDFKKPPSGYPYRVHGNSTDMFYKSGDEYWLVKVIVYANAHSCISRLETPLDMSFLELEGLMIEGVLLTDLPKNVRVNIYGLGSFNVRSGEYVVSVENKLLELKDCMRKANNQPTSLEEARQALEDYDVNATEANKLRLKAVYERMPEHMRLYIGGMDDKDHRVRNIIYRN